MVEWLQYAVEVYVGTGCVIGQFNSDCQQKNKKTQKIDINYVQ